MTLAPTSSRGDTFSGTAAGGDLGGTYPNPTLAAFVGCGVARSASLTLTTGVNTLVTFDSEAFDVGAMHSLVTNTGRLTAPSAGTYLVTATAQFAANVDDRRGLTLRKNDTGAFASGVTIGFMQVGPSPSGGSGISVAVILPLIAGDWITYVARQDSGVDLPLIGIADGGSSSVFSAIRLGP